MTEHWMDKALREHRLLNLQGHFNRPRISADTMLKLVRLRNDLTGDNKSIYEASLMAEERGQF